MSVEEKREVKSEKCEGRREELKKKKSLAKVTKNTNGEKYSKKEFI